MPRLDGPGLFARILTDPILPRRHAYLYTTGDRALSTTLVRQLGARHAQVLWKPFDAAELHDAVADAARRLSSSAPPQRLPAGSKA